MDRWAGIVLAAGQGERMKSRVPKPLHPVCGKEMIRYPVDLLTRLDIHQIVAVVSPANKDAVMKVLGADIQYVVQPAASGTGDALRLASDLLRGKAENLLVQGADVPLVSLDTLKRQMESHLDQENQMTALSAVMSDPGDLGRVKRDSGGQMLAIVESAEDQGRLPGGVTESAEVNGGVYCFVGDWLWENLARLRPSAGGETFLTSLAAIGADQGHNVDSVLIGDAQELLGVNDRRQLARAEAVQRQRVCQGWMLAGVTITDPDSVYIDASVTIGQDTVILPNTMLLGSTSIGEDCEIGPNTTIRDSSVGGRCRITSSAVEGATIENGVHIGPFSHLRPGAYLESDVYLGNYVEVKESRFSQGAVMGHFGYIGDASIGARANLGAGLVTCNYDGKDKHRTNIGAEAFIGCDTMLVAPVSVGDNAITGAGAVITKDVPAGRLSVGVPAKIVDRPTKSD